MVATTGIAGSDRLPFAVPDNARVNGFVPFDALLPLTELVVTNGGWGGILATLSNGLPLMVAGNELDKPEIAARVSWSGAGSDLHTGSPSPKRVLSAYRRMQNDASYHVRAREIADEMSAAGGATKAVELIEVLLATESPVLRVAELWPTAAPVRSTS